MLTTRRLRLIPLSMDHFPEMVRLFTDRENTRLMVYLPCDDEEEVRTYLQKAELQWQLECPAYLDVAVLSDGAVAGTVSVEFLKEPLRGELGWVIDPAFRGKGFAAEAAEAMMQYCASRFGLKEYIAHADSENAASIRVMEKLHMTFSEEYGGRKNRCSPETRREVRYHLRLP